ncbi:hypothetical protein ACFQ1L_46375 [Phytohabitans flavus]|uniref:hypothetical protein n=1 Tax=Phytohabitans flavus TaxID=1076124 RepID=UPI00363E99E7
MTSAGEFGRELRRWRRAAELFDALPPAVAEGSVPPSLAADVSLASAEPADARPVDLRVVLLHAAGHGVGRLAEALAGREIVPLPVGECSRR